jgi:hypothetical protein
VCVGVPSPNSRERERDREAERQRANEEGDFIFKQVSPNMFQKIKSIQKKKKKLERKEKIVT